MTEDEFIKHEISVWGEDYILDLIERGYTPVQLFFNDSLRWWWRYDKNDPLTFGNTCAMLPSSRSVVSPVSAG